MSRIWGGDKGRDTKHPGDEPRLAETDPWNMQGATVVDAHGVPYDAASGLYRCCGGLTPEHLPWCDDDRRVDMAVFHAIIANSHSSTAPRPLPTPVQPGPLTRAAYAVFTEWRLLAAVLAFLLVCAWLDGHGWGTIR